MEDLGITAHHFFKNAAQMQKLFADLPEAIENSLVIAQRCSFVVSRRDPILPSTDAKDEAEQLRIFARQGLQDRVGLSPDNGKPYYRGEEVAKRPEDRLEMELILIISGGVFRYFLIVSDLFAGQRKTG